MNLPDDPMRPLDSTRLVSCGSFEARFEMSLPPGRYVLQGYNEAMDAFLVPDKEIDLVVGAAQVDVGVLMLSNTKSHIGVKIEHAKSGGPGSTSPIATASQRHAGTSPTPEASPRCRADQGFPG